MKEGNALLDSYHAKEEKFRNFLQMKDAPVIGVCMIFSFTLIPRNYGLATSCAYLPVCV